MGKVKNFWIESFEYGLEIGMTIDEAEHYATESEFHAFEDLSDLDELDDLEQDEDVG